MVSPFRSGNQSWDFSVSFHFHIHCPSRYLLLFQIKLLVGFNYASYGIITFALELSNCAIVCNTRYSADRGSIVEFWYSHCRSANLFALSACDLPSPTYAHGCARCVRVRVYVYALHHPDVASRCLHSALQRDAKQCCGIRQRARVRFCSRTLCAD